MDIKDLEVLIECKRLVEELLKEKRYVRERVIENGKYDVHIIDEQIIRMERALQGKPPRSFYDKYGKL